MVSSRLLECITGADIVAGNVIFIITKDQLVGTFHQMFDISFQWGYMNSDEAEQYFKLFYSRVKDLQLSEGVDLDVLASAFGEKVAEDRLTQEEIERHLLQYIRRPEEAADSLPVSF